eukprot:840885_1
MLLSCLFPIAMIAYKLRIDVDDFTKFMPSLNDIQQEANVNENTRNGLSNVDRLRLMLSGNDFDPNDFSFLNRLDQDNNESMIKGLNTSLIQQIIPKEVLQLEQEDECSICLLPQKTNEEIRILPCNHQYHAECIDLWLNSRAHCP